MGRGGERAKGEREGGARSVTLFAPSLGTRTSLPLPHRIENLSPISQTRKRRLREARQVAAARPTGSRSGSKACLESRISRASQVSGMFHLHQVRAMGTWGSLSTWGRGDSAWRGPSLTSEGPQAVRPSPSSLGGFYKPFLPS